MVMVTVDGVNLYYETKGEGERIVLTHGSWTDGRTWEAVVGRLAERFEVVTWDRRGHSRSQSGAGPGSYREDASDLVALIEHLGDEPVHAIGNSSGGSVVLVLVTMRPDLVASAAVHEPDCFGLLSGTDDHDINDALAVWRRESRRVFRAIAEGEHRAAAEYFVDHMAVGPGAWEQLPDSTRKILEANAPTFLDEGEEFLDSSALDVEALAETSVPLLITHGSQSPDLLVPAARELAHRAPTARLEAVAGAGHIPHRTHPDAYVASLIRFVEGLSSPTTESAMTGRSRV